MAKAKKKQKPQKETSQGPTSHDDTNVRPVEVSRDEVLAMKLRRAKHINKETKSDVLAVQMHAPFQVMTSPANTLAGGRTGDWILVHPKEKTIIGVVLEGLFEQSYELTGGKSGA